MSYGIQDDLGIWVVVPDGNFPSRLEAQAECDRRNREDGIADATGRLFMSLPVPEWKTFYAKHRARPDCTCKPERDPLIEFLREGQG